MSYSEKDYSKKISFAEDWLKKAKRELEQGSSITAGSHIILAIAEMETLKRSLFPDSAPMQKAKKASNNSWVAFRPIFAIVLLVIALGLFSFTMRGLNDSPANNKAAMENRSESLVAREGLYESIIEQKIQPAVIASESDATPEGTLQTVPTDNAPNTVRKPETTFHPKPKSTGNKSNAESIKPVTEEEKSVVAEEKSNPPVWLQPKDDEPELLMKEIQLETIIAARESLNEE